MKKKQQQQNLTNIFSNLMLRMFIQKNISLNFLNKKSHLWIYFVVKRNHHTPIVYLKKLDRI